METKLKVMKEDKNGKSGVVIVCQSGMFQSAIAIILKSKKKVTEFAKGSASWKAMKLIKIL